MPTYEYLCSKCGLRHEERRAVVDRHSASRCPACGTHARLVMSVPADRNPGADTWRTRMKSRGEGL